MSSIVELNKITKIYKGQKREALKDFSLQLHQGDMIALTGPSGSGKSTILNIIGLLDEPSIGKYNLFGKNTKNFNQQSRAIARNQNFGFIFQFYYLLNHMNILDNVALPLVYRNYSWKQARSIAHNIIEQFDLCELAYKKPFKLSGGEQQRIAISRALVGNPKILLADEPTGSLDEENTNKIMEMLLSLNKKNNITIIMVTHDEKIAAKFNKNIRLKKC